MFKAVHLLAIAANHWSSHLVQLATCNFKAVVLPKQYRSHNPKTVHTPLLTAVYDRTGRYTL